MPVNTPIPCDSPLTGSMEDPEVSLGGGRTRASLDSNGLRLIEGDTLRSAISDYYQNTQPAARVLVGYHPRWIRGDQAGTGGDM